MQEGADGCRYRVWNAGMSCCMGGERMWDRGGCQWSEMRYEGLLQTIIGVEGGCTRGDSRGQLVVVGIQCWCRCR